MTRLFLLTLTLLSIGVTYGQEKRIPTQSYKNRDYYPSVTYLNEGDSKAIKEQEKAFRVVIITSEIYDQLLIETVTFGDEGGNKKIINRKTFDLDYLWKAFNLKGEIAGLKFIKWVTWDSFEIDIFGKAYLVKNISATTVTVKKKNSSP